MISKAILKNVQRYCKLQKMDYISDQRGIMSRYLREKETWDKHLEESKEFIRKSAQTKEKKKVVVLGSGWLLDLPLEELSRSFKEVILIDINHPYSARRKANQFPNVHLQTDDITGGLVDYFYEILKKQRRKNKKVTLPALDSFSFSLPQDTDFVISLNVMCQLNLILVDYIKSYNLYSDHDLHEISKHIQKAHIHILPKNKTCLITDIDEEIIDEKDQMVGVNPIILVDLPQGNFSQKWQWQFDSQMTYREDFKTYFNTLAIDF